MSRSHLVWAVAAFAGAAAVATFLIQSRPAPAAPAPRPDYPTDTAEIRAALFEELRPVKLRNCELQRFGEANDGGYLLCVNLLGGAEAGYSYGISGYDGWGCDVSTKAGLTVHQYDCFDPRRPVCASGRTVFHDECIASHPGVRDGRPFDTLENQVSRNGDAGKHLVLKIDVEGAEWDAFMNAPHDLLERIDQIAVEFHGYNQRRFLRAIRKLKKFFHVAHLHWNNHSCGGGTPPFPAWAYEALLVNRRLAEPDPGGAVLLPHPLDAPNHPSAPDCQG